MTDSLEQLIKWNKTELLLYWMGAVAKAAASFELAITYLILL